MTTIKTDITRINTRAQLKAEVEASQANRKRREYRELEAGKDKHLNRVPVFSVVTAVFFN